jgi:thiamine pyrophosphokinase
MRDNFSYSKVIALGAFGGRIDYTLSAIHVLYKMNSFFQEKCRENEIILIDEHSIMTFLEAGENLIRPS